jgi:N-acetylmuramoyl-L-alanine amidase
MIFQDEFLTINQYSRSGYKRSDTLAIVLHWLGSAGQSAYAARNYFESLKDGINEGGALRYASAQYIVNFDGTVVRTMPDDEVAYHCGAAGKVDPVSGKLYTDRAREIFGTRFTTAPYSPNYVTIGIEMAHRTWTGEYTKEALDSAVELCNMLFRTYPKLGNPMEQILTHNQVVGWKNCPLWFFNHPDNFTVFKERVEGSLRI